MLEIGRQIVGAIIKYRGTGYMGKVITTPSGGQGRYRGLRERTIQTLMGSVVVERAY